MAWVWTKGADKREWKTIVDRAWWHCWAQDYQEYEAGPGPLPAAIVEHLDGTVKNYSANQIVFLDVTPSVEPADVKVIES
jgi:hypothetical protein